MNPPKRCSNPLEWSRIEELKQKMLESHGINQETTAIVATAFIGLFRKSIISGDFKQLCEDLYETCRPQIKSDTHNAEAHTKINGKKY